MQHGSCFVCLLCSWRKEGTLRSLNPTDLLQDSLYPQPETRKKSVAMAIVARYCRKSNQFQSVQGLGMHRTHKNVCKSKKQKESDAVAILVASYCRKLISSNLYRGMECKEPVKLFISSRNKKRKCCHDNNCCQVLPKN